MGQQGTPDTTVTCRDCGTSIERKDATCINPETEYFNCPLCGAEREINVARAMYAECRIGVDVDELRKEIYAKRGVALP